MPGSRIVSAWAVRVVFPPEQVAEVKALACELPKTHGLPLSRFSRTSCIGWLSARVNGGVGLDDLALAARRRLEAVAAALLDLRPRPGVRREGRPGARPLPAPVRGPAAAPGRVRDLRRREVAAAGARPQARLVAAGARSSRPVRVRLPAQRHPRLPGRLGRPPRQPVRPRRGQDRERAIRPTRGRGDGDRAVRLRAHRLLDRRQRLLPRRQRLASNASRAPGRTLG